MCVRNRRVCVRARAGVHGVGSQVTVPGTGSFSVNVSLVSSLTQTSVAANVFVNSGAFGTASSHQLLIDGVTPEQVAAGTVVDGASTAPDGWSFEGVSLTLEVVGVAAPALGAPVRDWALSD